MIDARVETDWTYRNLKTIILENACLKVSILPDVGSRIFELIYKPSDRDFLYHHPRVEIRAPVFGANFDNYWTGGIDEAIPSCHACSYEGEDYGNLGEGWALSWYSEILSRGGEEASIHLWRPMVIEPLLLEKSLTLKKDEAKLHIHHKITNIGYLECKFDWGIHPALAVGPNSRIDLGADDMEVEWSVPDDRLGKHGATYKWPYATDKSGKRVDVRKVLPPESKTVDLHYATKLKEGWFAITDTSAKEGIGMFFTKEVFRSIYLWMPYGGWRGQVYCVAPEPWTGYPSWLPKSIEKGVYSKLAPGETLEADSILTVFTGRQEVSSIDAQGNVS